MFISAEVMTAQKNSSLPLIGVSLHEPRHQLWFQSNSHSEKFVAAQLLKFLFSSLNLLVS